VAETLTTRWTGRREPNTSFAWTIIAVGTGLLVVSMFQIVYWDTPYNIWYLALLVTGLVGYAIISFTSFVEMVVELVDEELVYRKMERTMGFLIREGSIKVQRSKIAKVVERNAGFGVRVVRIENEVGRRLMVFPEFLDPEEHDEMIAAIIEWGNQLPSSPPSASTDAPLADSR
jgi:hypothetical protein